MKQGETLYNVSVERETLRNNADGTLSEVPHSVIFGKQNKNPFIIEENGAKLKIKTPMSNNTKECYMKLEEITNVALCEIYKHNELMWPYSIPNKEQNIEPMGINFKFTINEEKLKELSKVNKTI